MQNYVLGMTAAQMIAWLLFNGGHIKKILFALKSELEDFLIPPTPQSPTPILSVSLFNISFFVAQLLTAFSVHIKGIEAKKMKSQKAPVVAKSVNLKL